MKFDGIFILSDMDGTFLDSTSHVTKENAEAVKYFIENGGKFSFATGRSRQGMQHFLKDVEINAPGIVSNGAVIYDFTAGKPIIENAIGEAGLELTLDLRERFPDIGVEVAKDEGVFVAHLNEISKRHLERVNCPLVVMEPHEITQPWLNILITRDPETIGEVAEYIQKNYSDKVFSQFSAKFFYEVLSKTAGKGVAAIQLRDYLGIKPENFIVVGDGPNDVELLAVTENSYVTENGCDEAKRIAKYSLPANNDHAIAALIRRLDEQL